MYSIVSTAIVHGIDSIPVQVEADVSNGMPYFEMVGFLGAEVKEAKERVRTALRNAGYLLPAKRITVNLFHILMQFDLFKDIRLITLDNIQKRDLISLFIRSDRLIE